MFGPALFLATLLGYGHASCVLGACKSIIAFNPTGLRRMPPIRMRQLFWVGVNQIELAPHGGQNYQFLPEVRDVQHDFRNTLLLPADSLWRQPGSTVMLVGRLRVSGQLQPIRRGFSRRGGAWSCYLRSILSCHC